MPIQPAEYEALIEKLFDDRLPEEELQQLNDALRQSPQAREHYWHLVMLEGHLADLPGWIAGQQYATQLAFSETLEAFIEMESNAEAELQTYPLEPDVSNAKQIDDQPIAWQDVRAVGVYYLQTLARQKAVWGVAAAAMICIVALAYATWFGGSGSPAPVEEFAGWDEDTTTREALPIEPTIVAVVLNQSRSTDRESDHSLAPGSELSQGQVIALQADSALELEYVSGARVILQGPGQFELHSPGRVGMQHGQISAFVPPLAKGFTVSTPQTDFIDHGTEFAVTLDQEGRGEVIVLDGLIEATPSIDDVTQLTSQPPSIMMHEGFGGRLVPDDQMPKSVQPISETQAERYTRHWDHVVYRPGTSGQISYLSAPPASLEPGKARSGDPLLIAEQRGVTLTEDLHLNSDKANRTLLQKQNKPIAPGQDYVIPSGTKLNSFLIHFDVQPEKVQGVIERDFKLRFNGRIVAIMEMQKHQVHTDALFGLTSTTYPGENMLRGASDPPDHPNYDYIYISDDLQTLAVKMRLSGMDQIRVLVENTDP